MVLVVLLLLALVAYEARRTAVYLEELSKVCYADAVVFTTLAVHDALAKGQEFGAPSPVVVENSISSVESLRAWLAALYPNVTFDTRMWHMALRAFLFTRDKRNNAQNEMGTVLATAMDLQKQLKGASEDNKEAWTRAAYRLSQKSRLN
jgi:hypothetical protein